ncbi:Putative aspartic peptidase A1 family, aspartic peptidase, active [Septoria linicola]|uniref:Aspartic peptidase A1 family, aspartic peptidase, active n=1 Tax=Septoria linicola TaxID=215465 RepID=A0A9Q9B1L7_9PEZI|nr:putative aspartic peptidase A1 family, aspartic peptidase, active [Septoria linicola]USW55767.1 Putative aspartic peptidase A1 family, aspartic peptidase, active [Septoria linicola]
MRAPELAPLLLASAQALPELDIVKRDRHTGGRTDLFARSIPAPPNLTRRQDGTVGTNIFDVLAWSDGGAYYANLTVGTPAQPQTVILDTGSSDLYFDASSAPTCEDPPSATQACEGGTYDLSKSSTYNEVDAAPAFNTSFGDGSSASGPYGSDVIGIGDVEISPVQFGVATTVDSTTGYAIGLMGLGYSNNEAVTSVRNIYPNMPEVLKGAGEIASRLYSVFLNDADADSGTILFGGIDRSKYTGELATVNFLPQYFDGQENGLNFITTVTGANVTANGNTQQLWSGGSDGVEAYTRSDPALPVLLDTGSTAWSIPARYYSEYIAPNFPFVDQSGACSCEYRKSGPSLSLEFAGKIAINVTPDQFIIPLIDPTSRKPIPYSRRGNDEACVFLLSPDNSGQPFLTLGDAVLRSMYVVFDLDNGQGSIAQAAKNPGSADIVTVQDGPTGVAAAVSGVQTAAVNSISPPAEVQGSVSYSVATAATPVGTATGADAVPADAQVGGSGSSGGNGATSSAAAAGVIVPSADLTGFCVAGLWTVGVAIGAGLML